MKIAKTLFFCGAFLMSVSALLAESPTEVVNKVITSMKKDGSPVAMVEYIHWPTAFENLSAQQRQEMGIDSVESLRSYMKKMLASPSSAMRDMMESRINQIPPEGQASMKAMIDQMVSRVEAQEQQMKSKIAAADYEVKALEETQDSASVEIKTLSEGKEKVDTVQLQKIDGKWYFPSISSMNDTSPVPAQP